MSASETHMPSWSEPPLAWRAMRVVPVLILALATSAHAEQLFRYPVFYTGVSPNSVAMEDLNGDGWRDCVVAHNAGLVVLLRNGDGTFRLGNEIGMGKVSSVAIADLNSDGRPDLAVALVNENAVLVLPGNGDGTFMGPHPILQTGSRPTSVAIADLNTDGRLDLVVVNFSSNSVSMMLGNGNGTFGTRTDFSTGIYPFSMAIADLNADARPDLVVVSGRSPNVSGVGVDNSDTVSVLLGNGDGTFNGRNDFIAGNNHLAVAIADLDGDARLDLALPNSGASAVSVLLGNGDGTFGRIADYGTEGSPHWVTIADLNADGQPDLATANGRSISVLLGNGDGTFGTATSFGRCDYPVWLAIEDFDGDGQLDLAVASSLGRLSVLSGNGDDTFSPPAPSLGTGRLGDWIELADLNADGRLDLATVNSGPDPDYAGTVSIMLRDANGMFGTATGFSTGSWPRSMAIADLNGDARSDIVAANYEAHTVSVLLGRGDGTFAARTDFGTGKHPQFVVIGDFNSDGHPDLATANGRGRMITVLLGRGDGTFGAATDVGTESGNFCSVAIADLNEDGRLDLAATNSPTLGGDIVVFLGRGDGTFGPLSHVGFARSPRSVAIADLNADGRLDLAVGNAHLGGTHPSSVLVLLGNGDGTFGAGRDYSAAGDRVAFADFDGNGWLDLATWGNGPISVLLGNGDGTFGTRTDYGPGVWGGAAIVDLNSDGRPDLLVPAGCNTVSVLLNRTASPAPVAMSFELTPVTLNLTNRARWVTGYLEAIPPLAASDIDLGSIRLNATVPVDAAAPTSVGDHDGDGVPDLMVKFDRVAMELTLPDGDDVAVTVTGTVAGQSFSGTDHVRVRRGVLLSPPAGAHLEAGSVTEVRWQIPGGVSVELVDLRGSLDGGATWSEIAGGQPNNGNYAWTVPDVRTDQARVAVVAVLSDETGDLVNGVLGMSAMLSIEAVAGVRDPRPGRIALAMRGATPNPSLDGQLRVEFALGDGSVARLELMDVAGRVVRSKQVGALGPGSHALDLSEGDRLRPGVYFLRLTQGGSEVRARAAVLR